MNRASPVELRKALESANLYVKSGIDFVCVPVTSSADKTALLEDVVRRLESMKKEAA